MSETITFRFDGPVDLVNERRTWHYQRRAKVDREIRALAAGLVRAAAGPGVRWYACTVDAQMTSTTNGLADADAIAGVMKPILDGIVDAGILPDDGPRHVRWIRYIAPEKTGVRSVWVRLREIKPDADGRLL